MAVQDLRRTLHESIENINDEQLLKLIQEQLSGSYGAERQLHLTADLANKLDSGVAEADAGRTIPEAQADAEIAKWLLQ